MFEKGFLQSPAKWGVQIAGMFF
ncbi:DUF6783 domain-containing protein [Blautia sp. HCP3S3_H10_1]